MNTSRITATVGAARGTGARRRRVVAAGAVLAVAMTTSGCGVLSSGLRGVELPGGADLGDNPYPVSATFADVVDLVPQALVKVADVPVGTVAKIVLDPMTWDAKVDMKINGDVKLPANAEARVRTTSLLGEKFVELVAPKDPQGVLKAGAAIPLDHTGRAVEVSEVLGSLSLLLNGGGVAQIKTIATELNKAMKGNEPEIRSLLTNLDKLVGALDAHKGDITKALDGLNRLSATLNDGRPKIEKAIDELPAGIKELSAQRAQLVDMLQALDRLSGVATNVVHGSRDNLLADLRLLTPTLRKLAESGQALPNSLEVLGSPPFTDAATDAFAGDYMNLYANADLDLKDLFDNYVRGGQLLPPLPGPLGSALPPLPAPAQVLAPLMGGPTPQLPQFPLLGSAPATQPSSAPRTTAPAGTAPAPARTAPPAPTPSPTPSSGGLLGLFGGTS